MRLRYTAASPYAHLNGAAFPWHYDDREAAERVRAMCVRPEWVEIYDEMESF